MTYTHKNLTLNVTTLNPDWVDMIGETTLTLTSDFVAELVENSCSFVEFFMSYQMEELNSELDEDEDLIIKHFKELDEDVDVTNADAIIAVYEYALDEEERQFNFDVETEHISWVIHDTLHAIHDASGCTIYVASDIEKERILKSLEITKEQFPNHVPDYSFLEKIEDTFYKRFKERICLEDFKYNDYEEDYI